MIVTSSSPTDAAAKSPGFTLVEMLVVLSIIAVIAALAVRGFGQPSPVRAKRERAELGRLISEARVQALLTGRIVELAGKDLPPDVQIEAQGVAHLRWYPDGSAQAARILRDGRAILSVDPITGAAVEIHR